MLLFFLLLFSPGSQDPLPKGVVIERVHSREAPDKSYALYLPENYDPARVWPLFVFFDPAGRASLPLERYRRFAQEQGFILACPYGAKNYIAYEESYQAVVATWNDVLKRFSVDTSRIYCGGFSGGARLAAIVARMNGHVAGIVLCGAGFSQPLKQKLNFPVVLIAGHEDMNFLEMVALERKLKRMDIDHLRLIFDGGHRWPPLQVLGDAVAWLLTRTRPQDAAAQAKWRARAKTRIDDLVEAGARGDALRLCEKVSDDPLSEAGYFSEMRKRLRGDSTVKKAISREKKAISWEKVTRERLLARLDSGERMASRKGNKLDKELGWWKRELKFLQKRIDDPKNVQGKRAATRVRGALFGFSFESPIRHLQSGAWEKAIFFSKIGELLDPRRGEPHFHMACAHAGAGRKEQALAALVLCAEKGYRLPQGVRQDHFLESLSDDPRFEPLMAKIRESER